ncbi:non-ribosomal peptide synthetase [Nocardia alba]|uniref:Non-ribosomal peptide synthase protein (TIGR01720 family)/amino acid adenylation domain-containing protein n=1 Tax=Nocardia alba TaxID=225051 RepID=A0A4R1FJQ7_9NOCA|nr:non-ribosomal peptide synthetase [Nocardia alba]TCJ94270.1 non-ribosomal peptide synthase protein (TIGR01720 family)/amino acid adenylation domain-containing protein [Nocardia alba]
MTRANRATGARARQRGKSLPQLLSVAVESNPGGLALSWDDGVSAPVRWTYAELDERSNRLARLLIARGVGPEDVVAVGIPRSPESVLAMWAVTKTGAAFLPVDPNYPPARVSHMLGDSAAVLGVAVGTAMDRLPGTLEWLCLDDDRVRRATDDQSGDPVTFADRVRPLRLQHPAYVVYTSGSTGLPKGVVVTHAGLAGYCAEQRAHYAIEPNSRTLHFASPSFDAAVLELLMAVGAGAAMVLVPAGILGGAELADVLRREAVTHMFITTAALASLDPAGLDALAVVTTGGEACPPDLIRRWATDSRRFHDCYGPTETTIVTNISAPLVVGDTMNIGAPLRGVTEYVLDERLVRVPDGMIGELYIAGAGLARGYHRQPGLTASRFVVDPFAGGDGRMYRTGDLVRRRVDGAVEFVGRNDFQVKVRGFRIELGEIDTALTAHDTVDFAVTVGHELDNGTTILAAYVHAAPGARIDTDQLFEHARTGLPAHMVPTALTVLDTIPLTPVGKLDRAALPAPTLRAEEFRAPSGAMEELVAYVFTELLAPANPLGADDDFFALGGNSLLATRAAARLGAELSARVPAGHVFESPTVAGLAALLEPLKGAGGHAPLAPRERPGLIPLSAAQQRMWFLNQFDPNSTAETIPFALRLSGPFDARALHAALSDLVARHESLRTLYPVHQADEYERGGDGAVVDGVGHQVVLPMAQAVPDVLIDSLAEDELPLWLAEFAGTGFDVAAGVPFRVALAELGPNEHVLAIALHHITADGASVAPLLRDLLGAYLARRNRSRPRWQPLPVQYVDYTLWHRELLGAEGDPDSVAAAQISHWRTTLAGLPDRLDLPTDRPRPPVFTGRGAEFGFQIPAAVHTALAELAQRSGTSEFMVVHAAFAVLLGRVAHTDDIAIGTPVAGRGARELDDLIGMFVNTLVLRTHLDPSTSFAELLRATKRADLAAFAHADLPFERLVELLDPVRSQAHHPLFQVALFFQNLDLPNLRLPGLDATPVEFGGAVARFDLQLTIVPGADPTEPMAASFNYATDLFDADTIEILAARFTRLLDAVATDADLAIAEVDLLTEAERELSLVSWNDTRHPVPPESMLDAYRRAVQTHPDATALVYADTELTYRQFDERVNALARLLIEQGVGPESLVGLALRRSPDLVIGMYAVLTAGGAYVPLDPDHPAERIAYILDTARPACVLSTRADAVAVAPGTSLLLLDELDVSGLPGDPVLASELRAPLHPDHPAYVIFTSGSTGKPKGVAISHAAIHNQLVWMLAKYPLALGDVYLQKTATTFDVSLWGYFMPLRVGAKLVLTTPDGHRDPAYLIDLIGKHKVTVTDFVPSMLTMFAAQAAVDPSSTTEGHADLESLREIFVIGEALPAETVDAMAAVTSARLHNLYGPTEAAVSVTYWPARPGERSVPIGLPQWNSRVYVLDERLRPVPPGIAGELYLAGDQLARGYVARPGLTADRFIADPFASASEAASTGARMYRTGDLVVWRRPTANAPHRLDYLGRIDFQVKFRGQRIELGEIETALLAHESVSQAVALVAATELGDQLVAYVVPVPGQAAEPDRLQAVAAKTLPVYMVPASITVLDELPLNPSGKLDRKALPAPSFTTRAFRAPSTTQERLVAGLFGEVLGRTDIGADDDFFALGGNSLVATRLVARLGAATGGRVAVRALFETPTVAGLAAMLDPAAVPEPTSGLGTLPRPDELPLSPAQRRMWFLNRFDQGVDDGAAAYNLPFALRLTGALDVAALTIALRDVLARHEVLRTIYPDTATGPIQRILPVEDVDLDVVVRRVGPSRPADSDQPETVEPSELMTRLIEQVTALASTAFDVTTEVPLRVQLLDVTGLEPDAPTEYVLAVVVHHIAADASSMAPLVRDVTTAYLARAAGHAPEWAALPVQYADYALWQVDRLGAEDETDSVAARQLAFWRSELADLPDVLELPTDYPRPAVASLTGGRVPVRIDAATHIALARLAREHGATVFMVLHTAFAVLLARLSGAADVAVGTPVAGRGERELDDLIGMFVNTVVLRTRYDGGATFAELLAAQRASDLAAFAAADVPFERLVEVLDPPRSTARHPLFQVGLSFQNVDRATLELPGLRIAPVSAELAVSQFDLHLIVGDGYDADGSPTGIEGFFTYATDLFDAATVAAFADRLTLLLDAVVREPGVRVGTVELRTSEEISAEIVSGAADLAVPGATLADLPSVARPAAVALVADLPEGRLELTYAEFDARVNRLARHLISIGVGPESLVALALPRSIDLVVAMYAVTRSGGAYVPIDPDQPADRTDYILHTAAPICVLTNGFRTDAAPLVRVDHPVIAAADPGPITDADRRAPLHPDNTAYVIFTSGSTGRPKGVAVPHAAVINQLQWLRGEFGTDAADVFLLKTPATFDLSVWEFWSAAVCGGRLVIAAPDGHRDPAYLDALITDAGVTTLTAVPSLLDALSGYWESAAHDQRNIVPLTRILAIGEALPAALAQRLLTVLPDTRIDNLYGPTEAAVSITDHRVTAADVLTVPIGTPEWNSRVYVLDERLRPVAPGIRGELYLGGIQLARGYLRRAAQTADRFVADPFEPGARMYRTGDLVARTPRTTGLSGGGLIYLGRSDFQVKIRGFRVEPGEVEAVLLGLAGVARAAVLARSDAHFGDRLVAYVVGADLDVAQLKSALGDKLPTYLVPDAFVVLDELPYTVNGKLDRKALPAPVFEAAAFRAPATPTEQVVAQVYGEILGVASVGADDDFFALGGNSLLATRAAARIGTALDRTVGVRLLFEAPTVADLALRVHRSDEAAAPRLLAGPRPRRVPLSLAQQRMWLLNRLDPDATVYNIPAAIRLTGDLDLSALRLAVADLFARHEVLRTRYPVSRASSSASGELTGSNESGSAEVRADMPFQDVLAPDGMRVDLTPVEVATADLVAAVRDIVATGFDVTAEPPVRLRLLRLGADDHVLVFVAHHISADGFSMGPLTRDLVLAYTARTAGSQPAWSPLPLQYADYAVWQRDSLGDEADPASVAAAQLAYWQQELAGLPEEIALPADRARPAVQSFAGATSSFEIDAALHAELAGLARAQGVTVFMVVQAALAVLLARLSGTDDVAIGTPIAGRGARELDDLVGMFVNTLVLRSRITESDPFTALLTRTRDTDLRAFAHADVPFERVVDAIQPARSAGRHPLFQVALSFENLAPVAFELPGITVGALDARTAEAKFDLLLTVREQQDNGGMHAEFAYATDLFDDETVRGFGERFVRLLTAVAAEPELAVGDIDLLDPAEFRASITFAGPAAEPERTLAQLMDDAVRADPTGIALRGGGRGFTYTALDAAANQLARGLIARGAGPEVAVAVAIRRSVESVLAVWAIARTGAVIVPVDPGYPAERISHMVTDSGAVFGITLAAEVAELPALDGEGGWVVLDDRAFAAEIGGYATVTLREIELLAPPRTGNAAYMIYTSGSTGLPKGVVVTHAGLANFCAEQKQRYRLDSSTRALAFASPSFDASMLELLLALGGGGTLVVAPAGSVGGTELAELIRTEGVTHTFLTPSVLATLDPDGIPGLRALIVGGEHVPADLAARWNTLPQRRFHNGYGPTETTVMTAISDALQPDEPVHMGGPIRGVRALILDERLRPVPEGVTGELYLGGIQLARGYHQRPALTAARFIADPFAVEDGAESPSAHSATGARLYRTGDLVRRRGEVLEFVGRNDFQVKIRGLRIELGEIDAVLADAPGVSWVATLGRDNGAGSTMLVSYVLAEQGSRLDTAELTALAARVLPDYMVPAAIVVLDEIPLTPVGKLDRRALPDPIAVRGEYRPPRTSVEKTIARVIADVLAHERVGLDDDFFALGGDSITAIQVVSRATTAGVILRPRDLFDARTVAALAERAEVAAMPSVASATLPLTATAAQLTEAGEAAVEPRAVLLEVPADCPDDAVAATVAAVMSQHPMLWALLDRTGDTPVLRIPPPDERIGDAFRRLDSEDGESSLPVDDIVAAAAAALDPDEGRNIHFVLTGDAGSATTLIVVANALVLDENSWRAVVDQLTTAWSRGRHAAPAAPDAGLGELVRHLAAYPSTAAARAERAYWHRAIRSRADESTDLHLRNRVSLSITGEGTTAVRTVADAYRATLDEVLLTAAALALHTGAETAVARAIGTVVRLRADQRLLGGPDVDNVVGGFTTDYPLALRLDGIDVADALVGGPAAGTALAQIKELRRAVPAHGAGFGLLRYLDADSADSVRTLDRGRFAVRMRDLRPARVHTDVAADDLALVLTVDVTDDGLVARFDYATAVLTADAVKTFAEHWIRALGGLAEHGLRPGAGGFTPSDFPLVRLGQTELTRLVRRYPQLSDVWPVTPLQSGMLFHALLAENSVDPYITQFVLDLDLSVDAERLHQAAQTVLDRHDNLRVAFASDAAGTPLQVVLDDIDVPWRVVDAVSDAAYQRIRAADLVAHFDMATAPLLRFTLVRTAETAHLLVTSHHILIDGWSTPLLLQELLTAYVVGGRSRHLPKVAPYRDYLAWLVGQDLEAARTAWRTALTGLAEPTPLAPVDQGREIATGTGETGFALAPADTAALSRLAASLGVTVNTVVQAAWGLLIARLVDRDDVVFGATVSGRPAELDGVEHMVGLFLNAIPVRVRLRPGDTVAELLRELQDGQAALLDHHYLGLGEIQEIAGIDALFDSLVVFESFPVDREGLAQAASGSAAVTGMDAANGTHYPLTVQVVADEQLRVSVKYLRDVFGEDTANALAQRFSMLLARFVADPQARIAEIDVLLAEERATLAAVNATDAPELLDEATLLSLFDAQVGRTPQAIALIDGETTYTYAQFDERARGLAAALRARGAAPETLVAVAMRRGIDLVTAIYAVLRTGAAYVPVDPDHPAERTERVLASAAPICVLAAADFTTTSDIPVVDIATVSGEVADLDLPKADNLAYVIHTSGSTGTPKGVMLTHRQLVNQFRWAQRTYPHGPGEVVLHKTPATFDISTWELLWPLQTGATVVIAAPDGHRDPAYLAEVITEHAVTTVHFVPSMLDAFLADRDPGEFGSLRRVFAAGEALSSATARRFAQVLPAAALVNWYGPAEATVVTAAQVEAGSAVSIPIGIPVANTRVHVLDRQLRPVPPGTAGELYLEGVQLARGYLGAPTLTAERFVAHPGGGRLYRTGDVVRWTTDETLEYLGRSDFQVKLRGQRIELGEVEAVLRDHHSVRHAAVALVHGPTGDRLVGYIVPTETPVAPARPSTRPEGYSIETGSTADVFDQVALLAHARAALPSYMVPATVVIMQSLPLNASGKLDRNALPVPAFTTRAYRPPTTPLQRAVAEVYAEVLGAGKVGLDDDFFELGGNSLVATKAISRLRTRVGAEVRVQWFFTDATVAALAERIDATQSAAGDHDLASDLESDDALGVLLTIRNRVPHGTEAGGALFCIHPMYGLSWCYAGLAQYIPARRPIFGLQSPALSEAGYLPGTLAEMARRYAAEIRTQQPHGPYRLMGWSLGGVLAHAVATELQAAGEQVSLLAMLDSHPDIDVPDFHTAVRDALAELGVDISAALPAAGVRELSEDALAALHAIIPANMAVLTPERVRRIYRSAVRSAELIAEHRPAVFRGRLEYFSALGHEAAAANWAPYVDGAVRDRPVAVVHDQMTSPQALAEIGPRLAELLDAGDRAAGAR